MDRRRLACIMDRRRPARILEEFMSIRFVALFILLASFSTFVDAQPCVDGQSGGYACNKVRLQAQIALNQFPENPEAASHVWGYVDPNDNREYAVLGLYNSTTVIEVTDPVHPRIVGSVPALDSIWREVKVYSKFNKKRNRWQGYAYISTEAPGGGIQIINLSELPDRVFLQRTDRDVDTSHTVFISNIDYATGQALPGLTPYLYFEGSNSAGLNVFSLKKPKNPRLVGNYNETYVHDVYAETFTDYRADQCAPGHNPCEVVFAWTGSDVRIIDFTDKKQPQVLSTITYLDVGYPHSGWISPDKKYLFSFDEFDEFLFTRNTRIMTINIKNFLNPKVRTGFRGKTKAIEHNGYVVGDKLYVSHYTRGLVIYDASKPNKLKEIGSFDTYPLHDDTQGAGAWGVYPFLPSGNILVSDIQRGLFILKEE